MQATSYELLSTGNWQLFFTTVERSLQIILFMQNKANFRKSQMNVSKVLTKDYDKKTLGERGKTKPIKANQSQLKPIQTQSKPIKANKMPKQTQYKANQTQSNPISKIFLTPFFSVFSTIFLIFADILPSFTEIGTF